MEPGRRRVATETTWQLILVFASRQRGVDVGLFGVGDVRGVWVASADDGIHAISGGFASFAESVIA